MGNCLQKQPQAINEVWEAREPGEETKEQEVYQEEIQEEFLNFIRWKQYASLTQRHYTEKVCYGLPAETVATRLSTAFNNYVMSVLDYKKRPIKVTTIKQFGLSDEYIRSFKS